MDDLDTICGRCREPDPYKLLDKKVIDAAFSGKYTLGVKSYVKEDRDYATYLFPEGIATPGTVLLTIPKKEKKKFERTVNTLTLPEDERYNAPAAVMMGVLGGLGVDLLGVGALVLLGVDENTIAHAGTGGLSLGVVGAIVHPIREKKSSKNEYLRAQARMSGYMMMGNAYLSYQMYDPAIIKIAIGE
ncbi:MAG: hypothetical protein V1743_05245 [Nanoarchaeota archaeon]